MDDAEEPFPGTKSIDDLAARRLFADPTNKRVGDGEGDVGCEEHSSELYEPSIEICSADAATTRDLPEGCTQAASKRVEHGASVRCGDASSEAPDPRARTAGR